MLAGALGHQQRPAFPMLAREITGPGGVCGAPGRRRGAAPHLLESPLDGARGTLVRVDADLTVIGSVA